MATGQIEMPADLYNGMALVLLKNLADGERASGQMAVFTPKPRLIRMDLSPEGEEKVRLGGTALTVRRYLVKLEIGGLTGVDRLAHRQRPTGLPLLAGHGRRPGLRSDSKARCS